MKTIQELFKSMYTKEKISEDINSALKEIDKENQKLLDNIPFDLLETYNKSLFLLSQAIAEKSFCLGFSTATKLTAESFVKLENKE